MTNEQILEELTALFGKVLMQPGIVLSRSSSAREVDGWDSLNHAILLAQVQKHFGVRFSVKEVIALRTVGELVDLVAAKLAAKA